MAQRQTQRLATTCQSPQGLLPQGLLGIEHADRIRSARSLSALTRQHPSGLALAGSDSLANRESPLATVSDPAEMKPRLHGCDRGGFARPRVPRKRSWRCTFSDLNARPGEGATVTAPLVGRHWSCATWDDASNKGINLTARR